MRYEISSDKSVLVEFDSLQVNENEKQCTHRTETDVLYISSLNFKVLKTSTSSIFFFISALDTLDINRFLKMLQL